MSAIRELAASGDGSILVAAESHSTVHLWDLNSLKRLRSFETTFEFGGRRLDVSSDGSLIAVGAYHRHGIAVYRSLDGAELWRRTDLKKVQQLQFSHDGRRLFCCFDISACQRLYASNGKSGGTLRGVRELWTSSIGPVCVLQRARDYLVTRNGSIIAAIPKVTFAALIAAFSRSEVCISEAAGPVRLFNLKSGEMVWRHDPPEGTHFRTVAYSASIDQFVGESWPFKYGGDSVLYRFSGKSGEIDRVIGVPAPGVCLFCNHGSRLVTASGAVIDVPSGRLEATLAFPPKRPKVART
jgi:WD40 repeat protein